MISFLNDTQKDQQTASQSINETKDREREPAKVVVKEGTGVNNQKQVAGVGQQQAQTQKNAKVSKQLNQTGNSNNVTIQLQNLKDFHHDQIDRSLSKIRGPNKLVGVAGTEHASEGLNSTGNVSGPNAHSNLQNVL